MSLKISQGIKISESEIEGFIGGFEMETEFEAFEQVFECVRVKVEGLRTNEEGKQREEESILQKRERLQNPQDLECSDEAKR